MSRVDYDKYDTEPLMVDQLLQRVRINRRDVVLEPAAGSGKLAGELEAAGLRVYTNDIAYGSVKWSCNRCGTTQWSTILTPDVDDAWSFMTCQECGSTDPLRRNWIYQENYHMDYHRDASTKDLWHSIMKPHWVIGNPPYSQLDDILERALAHSSIGVAFILRLTALEPVCSRKTSKRGEILAQYADNMRYIMPFSAPRPSFTEDGKKDSVTTAWFVWMHGWSWENFMGIQSPFQFIMNWAA